MIGIYLITNKINNKKYVGQSVNIEKRFTQHMYSQCNHHLRAAVAKYGKENFFYEVVETIPEDKYTPELLNAMEIKYGEKYHTLESKWGYNKQGFGGSGGRAHEETKQRISKANTGKTRNDETKKIMSDKKKQFFKDNPEAAKRISDRNKKIYIDNPEAAKENSERVKKFYKENPEVGKINNERIKQFYKDNPEAKDITNKKRKQFYIDNPEARKSMSDKKKQFLKDNPNFSGASKKVMCVETNKIYKSAAEAKRETGISNAHISSVCNGKRTVAGGYHWKFVENKQATEDFKIKVKHYLEKYNE